MEGLILSSPRSQEILSAIGSLGYSSLASVFAGAGPAVAASLALIGSAVWSRIQAKAAAALAVLTGEVPLSYQEEFRQNYERGRDRSPEEGGGHTLVDASGREVGVFCPAYAENLIRDANGNVIGVSMHPDAVFPGGSPCPKGVEIPQEGGTKEGGRIERKFVQPKIGRIQRFPTGRVHGQVVDAGGKPIAGAEVRIGSLRNPVAGLTDTDGKFDVSSVAASNLQLFVSKAGYEDTSVENLTVTAGGTVDIGKVTMPVTKKSEEDEEGKSPWYSSWWFVGGVVVLAGGVGYLIYRSRKEK
jgi:hypothetical protein